MKAKPTIYKNRLFRSRLEARWATMFDKLGWKWEYEPYDIAGWSPDFIIKGRTDLLVEVKPITEFNEEVAKKMVKAVPEKELLMLGCIFPVQEIQGWPIIGWLREWPWPKTCIGVECGECGHNPQKPRKINRGECEKIKVGFWGKGIIGRIPPMKTYGINGDKTCEDYISGKMNKDNLIHFYGDNLPTLFKKELSQFWQQAGNATRFYKNG